MYTVHAACARLQHGSRADHPRPNYNAHAARKPPVELHMLVERAGLPNQGGRCTDALAACRLVLGRDQRGQQLPYSTSGCGSAAAVLLHQQARWPLNSHSALSTRCGVQSVPLASTAPAACVLRDLKACRAATSLGGMLNTTGSMPATGPSATITR